jgi:dTMP kinase
LARLIIDNRKGIPRGTMRGKFITFEGIDGCGKTTVSRRVAARLRREGKICTWTCEPTKSWLGDAVCRGWAEDVGPFTEAFLFMADRVEHVDWICSRMAGGSIVVSDRYLDSTLAYQSAGVDEELAVGMMDWIRRCHLPFLLLPDITIYLKVSPETGISRLSGRKGRTKFEKLNFLRRVACNYDAIAALEPGRVKVVDASCKLETVVGGALAEVKKIL